MEPIATPAPEAHSDASSVESCSSENERGDDNAADCAHHAPKFDDCGQCSITAENVIDVDEWLHRFRGDFTEGYPGQCEWSPDGTEKVNCESSQCRGVRVGAPTVSSDGSHTGERVKENLEVTCCGFLFRK